MEEKIRDKQGESNRWWDKKQEKQQRGRNTQLRHRQLKMERSRFRIWEEIKKKRREKGSQKSESERQYGRKTTEWPTTGSSKCLTRCFQMQTLLFQDDSTLTWVYCYRCGSIGCTTDLHPAREQTALASQDPFKPNAAAGMKEQQSK